MRLHHVRADRESITYSPHRACGRVAIVPARSVKVMLPRAFNIEPHEPQHCNTGHSRHTVRAARSSNNATARSARSRPAGRDGPRPKRGTCPKPASSSGSRPPSGPTTTVQSDSDRMSGGSEIVGTARARAGRRDRRRRRRGADRDSGEVADRRDLGQPRPPATAPRPRARPCAAVATARSACAASQRTTHRRVRIGVMRATPSSVQPRDDRVEPAGLRERDRERRRAGAARARSNALAPARRGGSAPGATAVDLVAAPRARAVGGRDVLARAQPAHALEVVAVGAARSRPCRRASSANDVRRGVRSSAAQPRRAAGVTDLNADRMREKSPSCGGVTCFAAQLPRTARAARPPPALRFVGTSTSTSTTRSPRRPVRNDGTPRPGRRKRAPGCVPDGTSSFAWPSSVSSVHLRAERGLHDRDRQPVPEVVAAAFEPRVRRDAHADVEVAGRAAARRGRTAAREPQPLAVVDARRDLDVDRAVAVDAAVAPARRARVVDRRAEARSTSGTARRSRSGRAASGAPGAPRRCRRTSRSVVGCVPGGRRNRRTCRTRPACAGRACVARRTRPRRA